MTTMCEGIMYDSGVINVDDLKNDIKRKAGVVEVDFQDQEITKEYYYLKFRSLEGWSDSIRYLYAEWDA